MTAAAATCGGPPPDVQPRDVAPHDAAIDAPVATLAYVFTLESEPDLAVRISVAATGSDSGFTVFAVDREWGGVTAGGDDLSDPRAQGADGRTLVVERPEPHRFRVLHPAREPITLSYRVALNTHQSDASPNINRRPLLTSSLFHGYGHLLLAHPEGGDASKPHHATITWEGFDAAGWKTVSSFGIGPAPRSVDGPLQDILASVWMAGDFVLEQRDIDGRPLWVAVAGREWTFQPADLADLAARIVRAEREFFVDPDHPYYLITLIPVGQAASGSRSLGGTGLTSSFSLAMLPDTSLGGDYGRAMNVPALLAHEMFHDWNGHTILPADPEPLCYWFTEGFTDFYTRRLLYRSGLITLDEYARSASGKLAELWTSDVREAPNERIHADFWKHDGVKRLPYARGDVVAMMVDHGIRQASGGTKNLDDLMRQLVGDARAGGGRLTVEDLLERIETWTGAEMAARVRRTIVDGALPEIEPATFAPCLELVESEIVPFELGLDFAASRAAGKIVGVVPGSPAARAGLQDGQQVGGWSVAFGDVSRPVTLTIVENGARRDVVYEPKGAPIMAPQFRIGVGLPPDCPEL
jgi:predicted metalloprotease with PDZ domain